MIACAGAIGAIATENPKTNLEKPRKEPACFVVSMPLIPAARDRLLAPCYLSVKNQACASKRQFGWPGTGSGPIKSEPIRSDRHSWAKAPKYPDTSPWEAANVTAMSRSWNV